MNLDQEKRVMFAFALSFVILILWRVFFVKEPPPQPKKATSVATAPAPPAESGGVATSKAGQSPAPTAVALPITQGSKAEDIVVENTLYRVTFSTQGGVIKNWVLKGYRDAKDELLDTVNGAAC